MLNQGSFPFTSVLADCRKVKKAVVGRPHLQLKERGKTPYIHLGGRIDEASFARGQRGFYFFEGLGSFPCTAYANSQLRKGDI